MSESTIRLCGMQLAVAVRDSTLVLEIEMRSRYEAEIYAEDIVERLRAGERLSLSLRAAGPER